ncbi:putative P-loop containing nucleoside triphosphate hydrolase, leucine-rich repeat domain, L [Rosa chinensis]|uniref:Putative P-loop containing nucleoside triphosphate hydrolase, leucine-rich repeat domain, L n=1 Tax=Rosa chinensis TaxID=74649 RepID=A0A2P6S8A2_ROSCH|nr:putative disease resistance protein At3g14460 [Rosa chinensis]XP_024183077.1 putative disease resistance protein At3g14460 [Rosa chinensis]XP_024183084.1 putative disease resistance protein At3g14460 [Rosa chinensis]XP_040372951.1 putative disease resistance protein At3g14460 [Rosa chinensis]XP_040372956.1 putative disease resistance protein At3g14460 [Rosa chinensis]PRQ54918.1 putative P-loop containing nucleoside triphosphate hydrolase, leucine-rich repeat domain, L [Rosa chinensis]
MALAVVGGAFLSSFLNVLFDRMASRQFVDFFRRKRLTNSTELLEELTSKLQSVNSVLDDAEEKQIRNPAVKKWLDELKDAIYATGNVLDEVNTEALRLKVEGKAEKKDNIWGDYLNSNSVDEFDKNLEPKIKDILHRLELLACKKQVLDLKEGVVVRPQVRLPATSLVEEHRVYGRDDDKEEIIQLLLSQDASGNKVGVIPIVGMGGIGKTTLAQLVYNDDRVKMIGKTAPASNFDIQAWISVSEEFDVVKITQTIHGAVITGQTCGVTDLNLLQVQVKDALAGKKFLIVLDDVWNENYALWDVLKGPFQSGAQGSKIIITTRNQGVASVMGTLPTHHLKQLSEGDCWDLFARHAFENANVGEHPHLEVIGREIVRKCKGLPLAAKSLGGLLRSELNPKQWEMILNSDIWELSAKESNILPALWLSYQYLSSDLKRCFAYCSIFPKGYEFTKSELVSLWMAEDLLQPVRRKTMEQVGEGYFDTLISRSFFQLSSAHNQSIFTMHDLINDLAKFVLGEFCVRLEDYDSLEFPNKIRHLSYLKTGVHEFEYLGCLLGTKNLHTLLALPLQLPSHGKPYMTSKLHHFALKRLKYLRVLILSNCDVGQFLLSINLLKHLRYLDLSRTPIKELPDTVCKLYNLQTLLLLDCKDLTQLPPNLGSLINLRRLDIRGSNIKKMPTGMGKLKDLQLQSDFVLVVDNSGKNIENLKEPHLGKSLCISKLTQAVLDGNALEDNMISDKEFLTQLALTWEGNTGDSGKDEEVLRKLKPHSNLKELTIDSYGHTSFPDWLGSVSFCNLTSITLADCKSCLHLPPFGQLHSLIQLCLTGLDAVELIGAEFFGSVPKPFISLKVLSFINMMGWREWSYTGGNEESGTFPDLRKLHLNSCPKLTGMLPLDSIPNLESLELQDLELVTGSLSQKSEYLKLLSLCTLKILECPNFQCFPNEGMDAPRLTEMYIRTCKKLKSLPKEMHTSLPSLQNMILEDCPELESFPIGGLPPKLKTLEFDCTRKLLANQKQWGLPRLNFLRSLKLNFIGCDQRSSFPLELGVLPTYLTSLSFFNLPNVTTIKSKEFQNLYSLEKLFIGKCPNLTHLPEDGLPASLSHLGIEDCESLTVGDKLMTRNDFPKIAHIPLVTFDGRELQ